MGSEMDLGANKEAPMAVERGKEGGEEGFEVAEVPRVRSRTVMQARVRTCELLTMSVSMTGTPMSESCYCRQTCPIMVCLSHLNPLL